MKMWGCVSFSPQHTTFGYTSGSSESDILWIPWHTPHALVIHTEAFKQKLSRIFEERIDTFEESDKNYVGNDTSYFPIYVDC